MRIESGVTKYKKIIFVVQFAPITSVAKIATCNLYSKNPEANKCRKIHVYKSCIEKLCIKICIPKIAKIICVT